MTHLIQEDNQGSPLRAIALELLMIMPKELLQKLRSLANEGRDGDKKKTPGKERKEKGERR